MLLTRENSDVCNSLDEIYLVFTSKKQISSIYLSSKYPIFSPTTKAPQHVHTLPCFKSRVNVNDYTFIISFSVTILSTIVRSCFKSTHSFTRGRGDLFCIFIRRKPGIRLLIRKKSEKNAHS